MEESSGLTPDFTSNLSKDHVVVEPPSWRSREERLRPVWSSCQGAPLTSMVEPPTWHSKKKRRVQWYFPRAPTPEPSKRRRPQNRSTKKRHRPKNRHSLNEMYFTFSLCAPREPIGRVVMVAVLATVGRLEDLSCHSSAYSTSVSRKESATIWRCHRPQEVLWISSFASSHSGTTVSYEDCTHALCSSTRQSYVCREHLDSD